MTREEVAAFDALYGAVETVQEHGRAADGMAASLAGFGFSADEVQAAIEAQRSVDAAISGHVTEYRRLTSPILDYAADGRLARIATNHHCTRLTLDDRPVYEGDGFAILQALEMLDGGPILRGYDTVFFSRLCVDLMGFYGERDDGTVGILAPDPDDRIRHFALSSPGGFGATGDLKPVSFR